MLWLRREQSKGVLVTQIEPGAFEPSEPVAIATDIACRKCGYNLRGLSIDARCPECGIAVAVSTSGDLLRYCDPQWVSLLARGAGLMLKGIAVIFLGTIGAIILGAALGPKGPIIALVAIVGGDLMIVAGSWLLTTPDPSGVGEDQYGTARKVIRVTLLIGVGDTLIDLVTTSIAVPLDISRVFKVIGGVAAVVGVVGLYAELEYLQKLAARIPDYSLSSRAGYLKSGLPACYLIMVVWSLLNNLMGRGARPNTAMAFVGCCTFAVLIPALILGILYLVLIRRFSKSFRQQALLAGENWAVHAKEDDEPNQ